MDVSLSSLFPRPLRAAPGPWGRVGRFFRCLIPALCLLGLGWAQPAAADGATLRIGGAGTTLRTMRLLGAAFERSHPGVTVTVLSSLGSTGGIKAVLAGAIAIGVVSRPLSEAERSQGAAAVEYARIPLVFAVPAATRVDAATTAQLVDAYAGRLSTWPSGDIIRVIMRPEGDTNTKTLKGLSPEMADAVAIAEKRPGMLFALTDQDALDQLHRVPGALVITALSEVSAGTNGVKVLKLNGVDPSAATIGDGTYPLSLSLSLVTAKAPGALAESFIAFVRSEPGRKILADTGHWLPQQEPDQP